MYKKYGDEVDYIKVSGKYTHWYQKKHKCTCDDRKKKLKDDVKFQSMMGGCCWNCCC